MTAIERIARRLVERGYRRELAEKAACWVVRSIAGALRIDEGRAARIALENLDTAVESAARWLERTREAARMDSYAEGMAEFLGVDKSRIAEAEPVKRWKKSFS